jgi:hypothetical protein
MQLMFSKKVRVISSSKNELKFPYYIRKTCIHANVQCSNSIPDILSKSIDWSIFYHILYKKKNNSKTYKSSNRKWMQQFVVDQRLQKILLSLRCAWRYDDRYRVGNLQPTIVVFLFIKKSDTTLRLAVDSRSMLDAGTIAAAAASCT